MSGAKHLDEGKLPLADVPRSAVEAVASVLAYGARKYDRRNWRKGAEWTRFAASALRHLFKWLDAEDLDDESGLPHLAHAMCNLAFLVEWAKTHPELDDRYKPEAASQESLAAQRAAASQEWIRRMDAAGERAAAAVKERFAAAQQDPTTVTAMRYLEESRSARAKVDSEER